MSTKRDELLAHLLTEHDGTPADELGGMTYAELVAEHDAEHAFLATR